MGGTDNASTSQMRVAAMFLGIFVVGLGCGSEPPKFDSPDPRILRDGTWAGQSEGGLHAVMTVSGVDATILFDCATGDFQIPEVDRQKTEFTSVGTFTRTGGVAPDNISQPMAYRVAKVPKNNSQVDMTMEIPGGDPLGVYRLTWNSTVELIACP
jgi:hypothetical protein